MTTYKKKGNLLNIIRRNDKYLLDSFVEFFYYNWKIRI